MPCGFCSATNVDRCPVCDAGAERIAPTTDRKPPKPSNNPARALLTCDSCKRTQIKLSASQLCDDCVKGASATAERRARNFEPLPEWIRAYRQARDNGQYNICCALLIGNADATRKALRIAALILIDENATLRGSLSTADDTLRTRIARECMVEIGFDPRSEDKPKALPVVAPSVAVVDVSPLPVVTPKALPAGPKEGALMSGDWADLYQRVRSGQLTEDQATQIAQRWTASA